MATNARNSGSSRYRAMNGSHSAHQRSLVSRGRSRSPSSGGPGPDHSRGRTGRPPTPPGRRNCSSSPPARYSTEAPAAGAPPAPGSRGWPSPGTSGRPLPPWGPSGRARPRARARSRSGQRRPDIDQAPSPTGRARGPRSPRRRCGRSTGGPSPGGTTGRRRGGSEWPPRRSARPLRRSRQRWPRGMPGNPVIRPGRNSGSAIARSGGWRRECGGGPGLRCSVSSTRGSHPFEVIHGSNKSSGRSASEADLGRPAGRSRHRTVPRLRHRDRLDDAIIIECRVPSAERRARYPPHTSLK